MSYTILLTNGTVLTTIPDGTINTTSTSLGLPGRNYAGYGQPIDENFVWLTENFANTAPPANPLAGQLWYNTNNQTLYVCPTQGTTSASSWLALTSTSSGGTTTFGNVTVNGNVQANNLTVTNAISANAITVNFATVSSNLVAGNANITTANVGTLYTNAISSGSQSTAGTLTGVWTANGSGSITYTGPHTAAGTSLYVTGGNLVIDPGTGSAGIRADNYYYANGTPIPIGGIYGNSNVTSLLSAFGSNTITTTGNITSGNLSATGNVTATNIGNIAAINLTGSSSNVLYGNGVFAPASGGSTYGNANVVTLLAAFGSNTIVTTGNVTGGNFVGNGQALTGITSAGTAGAVSMTPQSTGTYYLPFISGTTSGNYALNANANFSANLANGYITATGFVGNGAALTGVTASFPIANGTSNIAAPVVNGNINITAAGNTTLVITGTGANITGTANISGNANVGNIGASTGVFTTIKGEGGNISNVQAGNVVGTVSSATTSATVTTNAQPNITSVGTLTSLTVSGTITTNGNAVGYLGIPQSGGAGKTTSYTTILSDSGTQIYYTGGNAATATTCSSTSTTLTVGGTLTGTFVPGMPILIASGTGTLAAGTTYIVSQLSGTTGGAGTYQLSQAPTVALASATIYGGPVLTIAANSSVAYPVGTVLTFINDGSVANLQAGISCADNLVWQASGAIGSRFLNRYGIAVATKVAGTRWFITGSLT